MNIVAKILGYLALIPLAVIWRGYVLATLWGWFIADKFGLPPLTVAQAIGLATVVGMFTNSHVDKKEDVGLAYVAVFVGPLIALLMGWIVRHWV